MNNRLSTADREKIADTADDLLVRFQQLAINAVRFEEATKDSLFALGELMDCDYYLLTQDLPLTIKGHGFLGNEDPKEIMEIVFPIDHAVAVRKEHHWILMRMYGPVPPSEIRGRTRIVPPIIAKVYVAHLNDDGTWWAQEILLGMVGGNWTNLEAGIVHRKRMAGGWWLDNEQVNDPGTNANAVMMCSMAFTARYDWHVALGGRKGQQGPRVLMPTNPRGCLYLLRDREKMANMNRRAALRHWVKTHYRERSETELDFVREHLRGHTEFHWHGLDGEIFVSKFDLEKNEFFKVQAEEWRAARKHNRVKVKLKKRV